MPVDKKKGILGYLDQLLGKGVDVINDNIKNIDAPPVSLEAGKSIQILGVLALVTLLFLFGKNKRKRTKKR